MPNVRLQYSTDQATWIDFGSNAHWNYANGLATSGNTITSLKLSASVASGLYHESASLSETFDENVIKEIDFTIKPVAANVSKDTLYYIRPIAEGNTSFLSAGSTYASIQVTIAPEGPLWSDTFTGSDIQIPAWSNSCWQTAAASWSNSCWLTAGASWAKSCWATAAAAFSKTCWLTAGSSWVKDANLAVSGD